MRFSLRRTACALVGSAALLSCSDNPSSPRVVPVAARHALAVLPTVRFSEIHYDNTGTDVGEAIEISGPAGTDVTGWQVVLYNGTGGASYDTKTLTGSFPATCGTRGVMVITYPTNGIQNGSPDGMALVDAGGNVIEFLSYEGTFAAVGGPANGITSVDIGVSEVGNEAVGTSLQRDGGGVWSGPSANTFGACNDNGGGVVVGPLATITVAPSPATIAANATQQFTATGADADGHPVTATFTWSSNATAVATIDAATGLATGKTAGDATITATSGTIVGTATLHVTAVTSPPPSAVRFSEIHYDNAGVDVGEAIEIFGPAGTDLTGWKIVLYDGNGGVTYNTTTLSGTIPATCGASGVVVTNYPENGIQNGSPDGMALVDASNNVVQFLSYEGAFAATNGPANGMTSVDIGVSEATTTPVGNSLQFDSGTNTWTGPAAFSFGACNAASNPIGNSITFSGRTAGDAALPVGFEDQLFATLHNSSGATLTTTFTWTSDTPALATIDANGVIHGLAAGNAVFRATAADNTTATTTLPIVVAVASTTAHYGNNTEFGDPVDADPSDDFIIRHTEYTTSYNKNRGTPNWVAYDLDASQFGSLDRCDCFTFDPLLPASFTHYTTADYTGAGAIAGYGIDRGHLARSFDRTTATLDNADTFLFSNIVPQAADLNQGPWAIFENFLGDLAMNQNKEVYIIAGVAGNKGTVKNEGKIVIPASTWKVAVIMPRDQGLANIRDYRDLEVIAVNMPNDPGVRSVDWHTYQTTVDAIEALSGYDLLALLPDNIERAVESNTKPPIAKLNGPYSLTTGAAVAMLANKSVDPSGSIIRYDWTFSEGGTATGMVVWRVYSQPGDYTVRLIVTDNLGIADTVIAPVHVANPPPSASAFESPTTRLADYGRPISRSLPLASAFDVSLRTASRNDAAAAFVSARMRLMLPRNTESADDDGNISSLRLSSANASSNFPARPSRNAAVFSEGSPKS